MSARRVTGEVACEGEGAGATAERAEARQCKAGDAVVREGEQARR